MKFIWISRHDLTNGQRALLPELEFDSVEKKNLLFGDDPVADLKKEGIKPGQTIGIVAPLSIGLILLRESSRL